MIYSIDTIANLIIDIIENEFRNVISLPLFLTGHTLDIEVIPGNDERECLVFFNNRVNNYDTDTGTMYRMEKSTITYARKAVEYYFSTLYAMACNKAEVNRTQDSYPEPCSEPCPDTNVDCKRDCDSVCKNVLDEAIDLVDFKELKSKIFKIINIKKF